MAATAGDGQAGVRWSPPATDGGSTVTSYTVTAAPGGASCSTAGTSCTIAGLTNGTDYMIRVTATNAVGTGPASTPVAVRPAAPIGAPPSTKKLKATAKVKAVKRAGKLRVRVSGDPGARQQWRFVVQKRPKWRAIGTYSTRGPSHVRTLNLPKGTYRVKVKPANGYTGSVSQRVRLKR